MQFVVLTCLIFCFEPSVDVTVVVVGTKCYQGVIQF